MNESERLFGVEYEEAIAAPAVLPPIHPAVARRIELRLSAWRDQWAAAERDRKRARVTSGGKEDA